MFLILYILLTFINLLAIKDIYIPKIIFFINIVSEIINFNPIFYPFIYSFINLRLISFFIYFYIKNKFTSNLLYLKNWWFQTLIPLNDKRYLINNIINGKNVKFIIKPNKKIISIYNEDYSKSYIDECKPFFEYIIDTLKPNNIGVNEKLIINYENNITEFIEN